MRHTGETHPKNYLGSEKKGSPLPENPKFYSVISRFKPLLWMHPVIILYYSENSFPARYASIVPLALSNDIPELLNSAISVSYTHLTLPTKRIV